MHYVVPPGVEVDDNTMIEMPCGDEINIKSSAPTGSLVSLKVPHEFSIKSWSWRPEAFADEVAFPAGTTRLQRASSARVHASRDMAWQVVAMTTRDIKAELNKQGVSSRGALEKSDLQRLLYASRVPNEPSGDQRADKKAMLTPASGSDALFLRVPKGEWRARLVLTRLSARECGMRSDRARAASASRLPT